MPGTNIVITPLWARTRTRVIRTEVDNPIEKIEGDVGVYRDKTVYNGNPMCQ